MLSLFLSLISCETLNICIYKTKTDLCSEYADEKYIIQAKNWKDEAKKIVKKFKADAVHIYIAENISDTKIDIYQFKKANTIILEGINPNQQVEYYLNASEITTFDNVIIKNSHCLKDKTTEFFIENLTIQNVSWKGFYTKTCIYGQNLVSDFMSVSKMTFKFETVNYSIGKPSKFEPNYNVDGAVYANLVNIIDLPDNGTIAQYGDQLIIIPESEEKGFRRTNFQKAGDNNVTYNIYLTGPNKQLNLTAFFSNREAFFYNANIIVTNSTVCVNEGRWSGIENINFNLYDHSTVVVKTSTPNIIIADDSSNSSVQFDVSTSIKRLTISNSRNISFTGHSFIIDTLLLSKDSVFDIKADQTDVKYIDGLEEGVTASITGTKVIFNNISSKINTITVEDAIFNDITNIEIGKDGNVPLIKIVNCNAENGTLFNLYHSDTSKSPDINADTTFLEVTNLASGSFAKYINNTEFPFLLSSSQDKETTKFGFLSENYKKQRTRNYYVTKDTNSSECQSDPKLCVTSDATSISDLLKGSGIDEDFYYLLNPNITIDADEFVVDTVKCLNSLSISGRKENTVNLIIKDPSYIQNIQKYSNVNINFDLNQNKQIEAIKLENCRISDKNELMNFENAEYAEFDFNTYEQFKKPLTPKELVVWSDKILYDESTISPNLPSNNTNVKKIYVKGVETVGKFNSSCGSYKIPINITIDPAENIKFTTNSFGEIQFAMESRHSPVNVNFHALLPVDFNDPNGNVKYILTPHFYGSTLNLSTSRICSPDIDFNISESESIKLSEKALDCGRRAYPKIKTRTTLEGPHVDGEVKIEHIEIDRSVYLNNDTYFYTRVFSNPDDDFLIYFNWTLDKVPMFRIREFSAAAATAFKPSIQPYAYPSDDDDFIHEHERIYRMGIPFLCYETSDYKGSIFHDGLVFRLPNRNLTVSTIYNKIAQDALPGTCLYFIPYTEAQHQSVKRGPENRMPWIITPIVSGVILITLIILLIVSYVKGEKAADNGTGELSMTLIDDV